MDTQATYLPADPYIRRTTRPVPDDLDTLETYPPPDSYYSNTPSQTLVNNLPAVSYVLHSTKETLTLGMLDLGFLLLILLSLP